MEDLKAALEKKLEETSHLKSRFETLPRDAEDEAVYRAQTDLYETLLDNAMQRQTKGCKSGTAFKTTQPLFLPKKKLTRMNDASSCMQWGVHDRARSELFMRREVEYIYLQQINLDLLYDRLFRNSAPAEPTSTNNKLASFVMFNDRLIAYDGYQRVVQELGHYLIVRYWLTPKLFMRLAGNENGGRVSISNIMDYVSKKLDNYQFRLELFPYDDNGKGYLSREKLTLYLSHKLDMEERSWTTHDGKKYPLNKYYIDSIVAEIFFMLDPNRTRKVRIVDLLDSRLLQSVRQNFSGRPMYSKFMAKMSAFVAMDEDGSELIPVPVFCEKFPDLSQDIWGRDEEKRFLEPFLHRLVKIYGNPAVDNGKFSFDTYLDLTLAIETLGTGLSSICYFFRVLDVDNKGYLDEMDLQFHYRNIQKSQSEKSGHNADFERLKAVQFFNLQSQIGDMLANEGGLSRITPTKLHKIRGGHTLIEYLIDVEASQEKQDEYYQPNEQLVPSKSEDDPAKETFSKPASSGISENEPDLFRLACPADEQTVLKDEEGQGDAPPTTPPKFSLDELELDLDIFSSL